MRRSFSLHPDSLLCFAALLFVACHRTPLSDLNKTRRATPASLDGGSEASIEMPQPPLKSAGQPVPLLYGRTVRVVDRRGEAAWEGPMPLGDLTDDRYSALRTDLTWACDSSSSFAVEAKERAEANCGLLALLEAQRATCRARAARSFAREGSRAGLSDGPDGPQPDLEAGGGESSQRWSLGARDLTTRASWTMFAVQELRDAIASLASGVRDEACTSTFTRAHAVAFADLLERATVELQVTTAEADGLLRERLKQLAGTATPEWQVMRTRGMNESLLERLKLYAAIPYGSFTPSKGEDASDSRDGLYPLGPGKITDTVSKAALLLASLGAPVLDPDGKLRDGQLGWFEALREAEPLSFGSLAQGDARAALARLQLSDTELQAGAAWLSQVATQRGTVLRAERFAESGSHLLLGLRDLDQPGLAAYPYLLTEARAALNEDEAALVQRGLDHALLVAGWSAERAAHLDVFARVRAALDHLAQRYAGPHARVCLSSTEEATRLHLSLRGAPASQETRPRFRLLRGRDAARCALADEEGCTELTPAWHEDTETLVFEASTDESLSNELYLIDSQGPKGAELVSGLSLAPLEPAEERCFEVPLSAALHTALSAIHQDDVLPALLRRPQLPDARVDYDLAPGTPTPLTWGHEIGISVDERPSALALGSSFSAARIRVEEALVNACALPAWSGCSAAGLAMARRSACLYESLSALERGEAPLSGSGNTVSTEGAAGEIALAAWALDQQRRSLLQLARVLPQLRCRPGQEQDEDALWEWLTSGTLDVVQRTKALRSRLRTAWSSRLDDRDAAPIERVRGATASQLALARLSLAVPFGLFEPDEPGAEDGDVLGHALDRFPVVAFPARRAEDVRAETLLRSAGLYPLLGAASGSRVDSEALRAGYRDGGLARALRALLVESDPATYAALPVDATEFLRWLGVSESQLEQAAARVLQLSESRIEPLLPRPNSDPVRTLAPLPSGGFNSALQLYALTEGRAELAADAVATSFGMRGPYHTIAYVAEQLRRRAAVAAWSEPTRATHRRQLTPLEILSSTPSVELLLDGSASSVALEIPAEANASDAELRARYEVWWTDAGLACATRGHVAGRECKRSDFLLDASQAEVARLAAGANPRALLRGLRFPRPEGWSPELSPERFRGRLYVTQRSDTVREVVSGTLSDHVAPRRVGFMSEGLASDLLALLAYADQPEGCARCVPRSVCETTRCEQARCVRTPLDDRRSCGAQGVCRDGQCDRPGCGDGARSDGSADVPFEACDDGNTSDGDGCSAQCAVEARTVEPLIAEAYPSGPAPAVGVDGQGQSLLVYTADALAGDTVSTKSVRFDAFGLRQETSTTLDADVPRGYRSEPTVAGLRDGGFVVAESRFPAAEAAGAAFRLVSADGSAGAVIPVEAGSATQAQVRVAQQEDGFVVAWSERSAQSLSARVYLKRFDRLGAAVYGPVAVSSPGADVDQDSPALASSLDQVLVVWSERSVRTGLALGVRGQRLGPNGQRVDEDAFGVIDGDVAAPYATVLEGGDYVVAWSDRRNDPAGDLWQRRVRRFGPAVEALPAAALLATPAAEQRPVLAAGTGEALLVGYQLGAPAARMSLYAPSLPTESVQLAQGLLSTTRQRDLSLVRAANGIWAVWSQSSSQTRNLFVLLLPTGPATPSATPQ